MSLMSNAQHIGVAFCHGYKRRQSRILVLIICFHLPTTAEEAGLDSASLGASRATAPSQTQGGARNAAQRRNRAFRHALVRAVGLLHTRFLQRLQAARNAAAAADAAAAPATGVKVEVDADVAVYNPSEEAGTATDAGTCRRRTRSGAKAAAVAAPETAATAGAASGAAAGRSGKRRRGGGDGGADDGCGVATAMTDVPATPVSISASRSDQAAGISEAAAAQSGGARKRRKAVGTDEMLATDFDPLEVPFSRLGQYFTTFAQQGLFNR